MLQICNKLVIPIIIIIIIIIKNPIINKLKV